MVKEGNINYWDQYGQEPDASLDEIIRKHVEFEWNGEVTKEESVSKFLDHMYKRFCIEGAKKLFVEGYLSSLAYGFLYGEAELASRPEGWTLEHFTEDCM